MMQTKHLIRGVQKICVKAFVQNKKYFKCNKRNQKTRSFWSSNCPSIFRRNVLAFGRTATSKEKKKSHFKALGCFMIATFNQVYRPVGQQ